MTIVISVLTHEYVVQVSDRRVVWIRSNGRIESKDDERNKAVNLCHRMAFGYTGLAELQNGLRTDLWLTHVLSKLPRPSLDTAIETIKDQATKHFQGLRHISTSARCTAFVGVGWAIPSDSDTFCPLFVNISNFHDENGKQLAQAQEEFTAKVEFLREKDRGAFNVTGRALSKDLYVDLRRNLRKCARKQVGSLLVIHFLAETIRKMASCYADVGADLMAMSLLKTNLFVRDPIYIMGNPVEGSNTFLYLPANNNMQIAYGPNFVCDGNSLTGYKHLTGETLKAAIQQLPEPVSPFIFYLAIVLTDWSGSGNENDSYRPAIADEYILDGYGVVTNLPSWPQSQPSPYFGYLVGINATQSLLEEISKDKRFFVVWRRDEKDHMLNQEWISELIAWLKSKGMSTSVTDTFYERISQKTHVEIIEELDYLLKTSQR